MKILACVLVVSLLLPFLPTVVWSRPNWSETSKLCGRDLIRAFVYICGGSRWRRLPSDGYYPIMALSNKDDLKSPSMFDVDKNKILEQWANDEIANAIDEYLLQNDASSNLIQESSQDQQIPWSGSIRNKREETMSFSKKCCAIGCSERDFRKVC